MTTQMPPPRPSEPERERPDVPPPVRAPGAFPRDDRRARNALIAFGVLVAALTFMTLGVTGVIHKPRPTHYGRFTCANNLSQLAGLYIQDAAAGRAPRSGPALFLAWRRSGRIRPGQEGVLVCPSDEAVSVPDTAAARRRYDAVDLDHPPADLCSYAVRDFEHFPVDVDSAAPQVLAACVGPGGTLRHKNGVNVAFTDGSARFMEREELGLQPGDDILIGPESKAVLLRPLRFADPAAR